MIGSRFYFRNKDILIKILTKSDTLYILHIIGGFLFSQHNKLMSNIHCALYIINCTYHERFTKYRIYMYDDYYTYNEIEDK